MAKITTIIDIGSNSIKMVVFEKTSRFAFHIIKKAKSKVKISKDAYKNGGILQKEPLNKAFLTLESFLNISKNIKSRKILCVATSALRDAPNKQEFISKVKKQLNLNIKVIDGNKEAYLGGVATSNLLFLRDDFYTIDIGGGSTEFALNINNTIDKTISLDIGTVRIDELFLQNGDQKSAKNYIIEQLKNIPDIYLSINNVVGLGGTIGELSRIIIQQNNYPFCSLNGFEYKVLDNKNLFHNIIDAKDNSQLKKIGIKKDRYDTIRSGTFIFNTIVEYLNINSVVTSDVGVREGLYLTDILRTSNDKFPTNFNISIRSLLDRFTNDKKQTSYLGNNISKLFDILYPLHQLDTIYKSDLIVSSKLQQIQNGTDYILDNLSYGFSHKKRVLMYKIIKYTKKDLPQINNLGKYKELLPSITTIQWLCFINSLNNILNIELLRYNYTYSLVDNILYIKCSKNIYLTKEALNKLKTPNNLRIELC